MFGIPLPLVIVMTFVYMIAVTVCLTKVCDRIKEDRVINIGRAIVLVLGAPDLILAGIVIGVTWILEFKLFQVPQKCTALVPVVKSE